MQGRQRINMLAIDTVSGMHVFSSGCPLQRHIVYTFIMASCANKMSLLSIHPRLRERT